MDKDDGRYTYIHTHTCSGILLSHKKNKIMPLIATWMDLYIITLNEVMERKTDIWSHLCLESKKNNNDTNEVIYKTETHSQTLKTNLWLPKCKGGREG